MNQTQYIYVTDGFDKDMIGSIWKLIARPAQQNKIKLPVYVVEHEDGTKWIGKDCGIIVTKQQNPEYFL